jgi:UDP-N-acetylglucosamine/UDP-N-acetylgalactosamine diphosphorylase
MSTATLATRLDAARQLLESVGQAHALHFYDQLDDRQRDRLLTQIEGIDWPEVARLVETHVKAKPAFDVPTNLEPAPYYSAHNHDHAMKQKFLDAHAEGQRLLRAGKVAAFTVAGGQGTRLGWDAPKGTFPATPIRKFPLFGVLAEFIAKARDKYQSNIPWYIMTSAANHDATCDFLDDHDYFGLPPGDVKIFPQAMMPALDMHSGLVLLEAIDSLALSPNGHGGSLKALYTSGATADMRRRGIEQISYTQIDNPLVKVVDPLFIGLHALDDAQMSSKMLPKTGPKEKLGNFCLVHGRVTIIEYSDLPDELAHQRDARGELRFRAGSIAIHMIRRDFVEQLNEGAGAETARDRAISDQGKDTKPETRFSLPFHRAEKKVPYIDLATGRRVEPKLPNAVKLETFVFDALPLCRKSIILETDRVEEFAPIKNADAAPGQPMAVDSPASSIKLQIERAARWLEANGVPVTRDDEGNVEGVIEIAHSTAIEPKDLEGVGLPDAVGPHTHLVI